MINIHECTSACRKEGCPLCFHGKDETEFCNICDKIVKSFLRKNGNKTWNQLTEEEKAFKVKNAGTVSWYKKTTEEKIKHIAKMQAGRKKSREKI